MGIKKQYILDMEISDSLYPHTREPLAGPC
jgi:hypothetical protein